MSTKSKRKGSSETGRSKREGPKQTTIPQAPGERHPEVSVLAVFVLMSGCAALVMQVAWMRELRLVFGATTSAVAAVLAIFMGGLGIGSAWLGQRAERSRNPLALYGCLEMGIAASAAVSPLLIWLVAQLYWNLGGQTTLGSTGATLARLTLAALVLAVPTFLMGGTLPAIVRAVTRASDERRVGLGLLYGANTLGAVVGSALATFFALETLGTRMTLWFGAGIGMVAGSLAVIKSREFGRSDPGIVAIESREPAAAVTHSADRESAPPWLVYVAAGVVGFAFFALELVWYRLLAPILGGTTYTFGLILCLALVGIGVGGLLYPLLARRLRPSLGALALTCGLEGLLAMVPFAMGDRLAIWAAWESQNAASFAGLVWGWTQIAAVVVFPVALISGVQFPLLIALLGSGRQGVGEHVGYAYAWNTGGAIAGSLVGGFGALPLLGAIGLWHAVSWLLVGLSAVILVIGRVGRPAPWIAGLGIIVAMIACQFARGPTAVWRHSAIGARRAVIPQDDVNAIEQWANYQRRSLLWETDGRECGLGLVAQDGLSFVVNGKSDGNALADASTQMGIAILGAVLHPDPRIGLVVGLGTGETTGWLVDMRQMERVDAVEIEPAIDEMARLCSNINRNVLANPRVRRLYNDAREYLMTTSERYDVIASAPSNPYRAGIANLYTEEFYRAAASRLHDDGVFVQFLQAYEVDPETIETVLTTITAVFPQVEIWQTNPADMQLVCYKQPVVHSLEELRSRLECPVIREAMAKGWHTNDLEGLLAHFSIGPTFTETFSKRPRELRNTDNCNVLEYRFAKTVGVPDLFSLESLRAAIADKNQHRPRLRGKTEPDWSAIEVRRQILSILQRGPLSLALLPRAEDRKLVSALHEYRTGEFARALGAWPDNHELAADELLMLMRVHCLAELADDRFLQEIAQQALAERPIEAAALQAIYHHRRECPAKAAEYLTRVIAGLQTDPWALNWFVETALELAPGLAASAPQQAEDWLAILATPLAEWRNESRRLILRVEVAQAIDSSDLVPSLLVCEPYPEWSESFLAIRAAAYGRAGHSLAESAERDLERYRRGMPR